MLRTAVEWTFNLLTGQSWLCDDDDDKSCIHFIFLCVLVPTEPQSKKHFCPIEAKKRTNMISSARLELIYRYTYVFYFNSAAFDLLVFGGEDLMFGTSSSGLYRLKGETNFIRSRSCIRILKT